MRVILASGSPRRRELLAALIDNFDVFPADIDEPLGSDAVGDAIALASEKARHIGARNAGAIVIAADTIVFDEERLYGKPTDSVDAAAMLRGLRGRDHRVVTGIVVASGSQVRDDAAVSTVWLANLADEEIERFVASGVPLDKAGGYAIQHEGISVVERLNGCYCNVMGLPLWRLKALLENSGVACADPAATYGRCAECSDRPAVP